MRFDWYAATVRDDQSAVIETLSSGLGADVAPGRALHGYDRGFDFKREGSVVARMLAGGRNGYPHVWASGEDTDRLVPVLRNAWPATHRVSRMDAAEDFDGPGAWDRLYGATIELALDRNLKIDQAGDWYRLEEGRTLYVGGRKSAVFARVYEKGKQLRGRALDGGADISLDLVRLEVQVRPEGDARNVAAAGAPEEAFGYSDWSQELARRVFGLEVDRVHIKERRESDDERALEWSVRQYGDHFERLAEKVGGWAEVGLYLHQMKQRQQRRREGGS